MEDSYNDVSALHEELQQWKEEAQRYRIVSDSFEKRVLDLQKELQKKDEEFQKELQKKDEVIEKLQLQLRNSNNNSNSKPFVAAEKKVQSESAARASTEKVNLEQEMFRKLFIGGLNNSTTESHLVAHFSQFGEIESCKIMRDTKTNTPRGFAFIVYQESSAIDEVQRNRPHHVDNRTVETKRAIPQTNSQDQKSPHVNNFSGSKQKIFVGGLNPLTEAGTLHEYFSQFGCVECVNVLEDKVTHKRRGFAYIIFSDPDTCDKVILQRYHMIDGHKCEAKRAHSTQEMNKIRGGGGVQVKQDEPASAAAGGWGEGWGAPQMIAPRPPGMELMQLANMIGSYAQQQMQGGMMGAAWGYGGGYDNRPGIAEVMFDGEDSHKVLNKIKPRAPHRAPGPYGGGFGVGGTRMDHS